MARKSHRWISELVEQARSLKEQPAGSSGGDSADYESAFRRATGLDSFVDAWSQAVVCSRAARDLMDRRVREETWQLARRSASPLVTAVLDEAVVLPAVTSVPADVSLSYFYEHFLRAYNRKSRRGQGVFLTPEPLAQYVIRRLDEFLGREFGLPGGLADTSSWKFLAARHSWEIPAGIAEEQPFVQLLDPAAGTGVFLVEVIRFVCYKLRSQWDRDGITSADLEARWSDYVVRHLLPQLCGAERSLPALAIAHLNIAHTLVSSGFQTDKESQFRLVLADTLSEHESRFESAGDSDVELDSIHPSSVQNDFPATVVLGNPPFSGISSNRGTWIRQLLHGCDGTGIPRADYYCVDGRPLAEKKHWLQDDYVKFVRYAQWRIERTQAGVVGLVTNHSYLDNVTFRGMRAALLGTFPHITVVDLHGSRKKQERAPNRRRDENVFGIGPGVAISLFRKPPGRPSSSIQHGELWGAHEDKLSALANDTVRLTSITTAAPNYFLKPRSQKTDAAYTAGFPLNEIMPVHSTAVVTARDRFVIGWNRAELVERLQRFRNLAISDDEIRATMFKNGRSAQYPPGDTRGWQLSAARRRLAAETDWQAPLADCLYRPFDRRPIYWADWMIDWPRSDVMGHLETSGNLAFIARRQMLTTQPCSFFWISDCITIDGVIRSDSRGSESVFPLYLHPTVPQRSADGASFAAANFAPSFVERVARVLSWEWVALEQGDLIRSFGARDLLHYIYALFHSGVYREQFASQLQIDFPRVLVTRDRQLFRQLSELGRYLVEAHTEVVDIPRSQWPQLQGTPPQKIGQSFPRFRGDRIELSADCHLSGIEEAAWSYRVGGHQVCRKWLRDRLNRPLTAQDLARYQRVVWSIRQTLDWMATIDRHLTAAGGWSEAFLQS